MTMGPGSSPDPNMYYRTIKIPLCKMSRGGFFAVIQKENRTPAAAAMAM